MTIFDLLFIALFLTAAGSLIAAAVLAVRGRRARALGILRNVTFCAVVYVGIVYAVTALSKPVVFRIGDAECSDDWCMSVEGAKRTPGNAAATCDITLRIFSRARRVAQRELMAKDVYLVDSQWRRYDPVPGGSEVPLNTLLQPGESVTTSRRFELPTDVHDIGLVIDRRGVLPICVIIGECGAFHKDPMIRVSSPD